MKQKWFMIAAAVLGILLAVALLVVMVGVPLWHWLVLQPSPDPEHNPTTTTPTMASTTIATEPSDPVTPGTLSFTGKVLEINDGMALMECYDKDKFDTVLVNYSNTPSVTPQVGEEYFVEYEDFMMPSLPPRIFAVKMERK